MEFLWICLGVFIGALVRSIVRHIRTGYGILHIDHSDPEKDLFRFEIEDLADLNTKSVIKMKIVHYPSNSQK